MKLEAKNLTDEQRRQVIAFLWDNGCRWYVRHDTPIYLHGRWIIVECLPIKIGQRATPQQWRRWTRAGEIPTRTRRFRNRVPLHLSCYECGHPAHKHGLDGCNATVGTVLPDVCECWIPGKAAQ